MRVDAVAVGDYNRIQVRPVTGTIGAEVDQVDLRDLDDETVAELHDAWMRHKVLLLSDDVKDEIDGAYAVHSYVKAFGRTMSDEKRAEAAETYPDQKHPVVRTHPVTGAKSLFVNRIFTLAIDGMDPERCRAADRSGNA